MSFDPVDVPTLLELIKAMSFQGILYLYGALSDQATTVPPLALIGKILTIKGHNIWVASGNPERQKASVDFVLHGLEKGTLKPIIDSVFPFDKIVDAHRYLEARFDHVLEPSAGRGRLIAKLALQQPITAIEIDPTRAAQLAMMPHYREGAMSVSQTNLLDHVGKGPGYFGTFFNAILMTPPRHQNEGSQA